MERPRLQQEQDFLSRSRSRTRARRSSTNILGEARVNSSPARHIVSDLLKPNEGHFPERRTSTCSNPRGARGSGGSISPLPRLNPRPTAKEERILTQRDKEKAMVKKENDRLMKRREMRRLMELEANEVQRAEVGPRTAGRVLRRIYND